jgi:hypothetical protein
MRYFIYLAFSFLIIGQLYAQKESVIDPIAPEKARVYVLCSSSSVEVFLDTLYKGKVGYREYIVLNVDTGEHLVWIGSFSGLNEFVEASLKGGESYVVNIESKTTGPLILKALNGFGLLLKPRNKANDYEMKKIRKFIRKRRRLDYPKWQLADDQVNKMSYLIKSSMENYQKLKEEKKQINRLTKSLDL